MKTKILISILFGALVLVACKKDPPPPDASTVVMPPLTHQGLNTFGCYINFPSAGASGEQGGELFVANDGESVWDIPAVRGSFNENDGTLLLQACRYLDGVFRDDVRLQIINVEGTGEYYLYSEGTELRGYTGTGTNCNYFYNPSDYGKVYITYLDKEKNIISGTFYATFINPDCESDSLLHITDGRFDFKY